jgi:hypothetical protein
VQGAILYLDGIGGNQGSASSPAGNTFSSSFTGHVDISNPSNIVTPIDYYYNPLESNTTPNSTTGSVGKIAINYPSACENGSGPDGDYPDNDGFVYGKIHYFLTDDDALKSANARDSLYYWVRKWEGPSGRVMETDMLMEDGNVTEAFDLYQTIGDAYDLTETQLTELAYGKRLLDIRVALMDAGKTMKEIDANQVTTLENIADSAKNWAKVRAENWLTLYDGRTFTYEVLWPESEQPQFRKANTSVVDVTKIYPNPVQEQLTVSYTNKTDNGSLLKITDVTGRKVLDENLDGASGQKLINVSKLQPGVYLYKIMENGATSLQGKFVKQ